MYIFYFCNIPKTLQGTNVDTTFFLALIIQIITLIHVTVVNTTEPEFTPEKFEEQVPLFRPEPGYNKVIRDRYCQLCKINVISRRPHHCRNCNRCTFEFDHHCSFLNVCIGRRNHLAFMVFLISSIFTSGIVLYLTYVMFRYAKIFESTRLLVTTGCIALVSMITVVFISVLTVIQCNLMFNGDTCLEFKERLDHPYITCTNNINKQSSD